MHYATILFDLDGTLTDSAPGILNSLDYAFAKLGLPVHPRADLRKYIGPPLIDSYMKYDGMTHDEAYHALMVYREYFETKGLYENSVYPGIEAMLAALKAMGTRLAIATGKPEYMAEEVCRHFDLGKYFDGIYGATPDESRSAKADIIAYALADLAHRTPGTGHPAPAVLMVGDRENDLKGGQANGLDTAAACWGYGTPDEFRSATYQLAVPAALCDLACPFVR